MSVKKIVWYRYAYLLLLFLGVLLLLDAHFLHQSSYDNIAVSAIICGMLVPLLQIVSLISAKKNKVIILINGGYALITLLCLCFGEFVITEVFHRPVVTYLYDPGGMIHTILAIGGVLLVLVVELKLKRKEAYESKVRII